MKLAAIMSVAALVAVTDADLCDVASLSTLLTSQDTMTCSTASGYAVASMAPPTEDQMAIMCTNEACQSIISQIQTLAPSECTLGTFALYDDLLTPLADSCEDGSTPDTNIGLRTNSSATNAAIQATPNSPPTLTSANVTDSIESAVTPTTSSTDSTVTPSTPSTDHTLISATNPVRSEDSSNPQTTQSSLDGEDSIPSLDMDVTQDSSSASVIVRSACVLFSAVVVALY